jgi:eukaryotic-like serine/threonine-protein kinase
MAAMSTVEEDDRVGSLIDGRYRILEAMAAGSMGAVYRAERVPVGKLVAVKFLHATYANDSEFLARFERETRVMSKLAHPNCVSVVDFGVWDGAPYLVMEYVGGSTLRKIMDGGALPVPRALSFARQMVAGLAHAHAQGITHRDVKPANIMISEEIGTGEHVRILDFGLARLRGAGGRDATQANVVVGTPNYMAPEQTVGGGIIDARTDIYAVGVVLFEMIAGERPFQAEDTLSLLGMHRAAPIPKLADRVGRNVDLPAGLQSVIDRAMAKSPAERFQSAIALAEALDALIGRPNTDPKGHPVVRQDDPTEVSSTFSEASSRSEIATVIKPGRATPPAGTPRPAARSSPSIRRSQSSSRGPVLLVLAVLVGGAYGAYYLQQRAAKSKAATAGSGQVGSGSAESGSGETPDPGSAGSAEPAAGSGSSGASDPSGAGSAGPGSAAGGSADPGAGSGSDAGSAAAGSNTGSNTGSGDGDGEVPGVPTPDKATNPDPAGPGSATDEDEDAPKTQEEVDKRPAPPAPSLAPTVDAAVKLIKEGKRELAVASLQALQKQQRRSAYIPFLLGNLYFDRRWWSISLDHYRVAITLDARYRGNPVLIDNVIHMLVSKKTERAAEAFLKKTIGRPALPFLQATSKNDPNQYLRKYATALARQIR